MPNLWLIFITGLTTGGLSCLAVQGGLLANVIAKETERDGDETGKKVEEIDLKKFTNKGELLNYYQTHSSAPKVKSLLHRKETTLAIILFLVSKIIAYTMLGFFLGWLGTMIQLGPIARGVLMLLIAVFMVGTAFRMLNIHPFFNIFNVNPPKYVRSFIRRFSKNASSDVATPITLGALTVLIPCGITQAMMVLAIGTGSPIAGALIMFSFTLGASPLFFILAYFTTRLGEKLQAHFVRAVAIILIIFGLFSLESGLNLIGSPISFNIIKQSYNQENSQIATVDRPSGEVNSQPKSGESANPKDQTINIKVEDYGYYPSVITARANIPTKIVLTSDDVYSCSRSFVIPSLNIQKFLPDTGTETIEISAQKPGTLRYSCSMGMYTGKIVFR